MPPAPAPARPLRVPADVASCIASATQAVARRQWGDAVEWAAAAAVLDIQTHRQTFLAGAREAAMLTELLERAFDGAGLPRAERTALPAAQPTHGRPLRLLYVMPSITQGQAASQRLATMLERHDRTRLDPQVIVTEEFTQRTPPRSILRWPAAPTPLVGGEPLQRLRALGVPMHMVPTAGDSLDGARAAIDLARSLRPDIAVFVASPACPIQAAMAWSRVAPTQVNQNIAVPLPIAGVDAVLYHNNICADDDEPALSSRGIRTLRVGGNGTDLTRAARAVAVDRRMLGVPPNAVLLATAANRLPTRMLHAEFAADLARFLRDQPRAWWMGIGGGEFGPVRRAMEQAAGAGVLGRVVLAGPQTDVRPYLKAADVYLNEYPEGGANTVLESMACGVPVVAMAAGRRHTECIGAALVGEDDAIVTPDPGAYWSLAARWCEDADERRAAGERQRERVEQCFDYATICREYERCYEDAAERSTTQIGNGSS